MNGSCRGRRDTFAFKYFHIASCSLQTFHHMMLPEVFFVEDKKKNVLRRSTDGWGLETQFGSPKVDAHFRRGVCTVMYIRKEWFKRHFLLHRLHEMRPVCAI